MTGTVATFYSYKGGVGRSALLANAATLLARWGYRVLCIDWDIEAPGLEEYFRAWLGSPRPGLVDLVTAYAAGERPDWRAHVHPMSLPAVTRTVDLMTAGTRDAGFAARVQGIDWRALYDERGFGTFLEAMRDEWKAEYDLVLVDSRTGITDIGGVCTVQLPDVLVVVLTANQQSLTGIRDVLAMATAQRGKLPLSRAGLSVLPILTRFDARGQDALAKQWVGKIAEALAGCYESWLDADISPRQFLEVCRVPYFSVWTFGERLAVLEERESDPECISYHFATIAALLARGLEDAGQLARNRDSYVEEARRRGLSANTAPASKYEYDFYVSDTPESQSLARAVVDGLRLAGRNVFWTSNGAADQPDARGVRVSDERALAASQHLVLVPGGRYSRWQAAEVSGFCEQAQGDPTRLVVEIALSGPSPAFPIPDANPLALRGTIRELVLMLLDDRLDGLPEEVPVDTWLAALAHRYMTTMVSGYTENLQFRDALVTEMTAYAREHHTSRDALASSGNDGLVAVLGELAVSDPERADIDRLLAAAMTVNRRHAAFRLLGVIGTLVERQSFSPPQREAVARLLELYRAGALHGNHESLLGAVETVERRLKNLQ